MLEGVPFNAKIALKGNLTPCILTLDYQSQQSDLCVYTSVKSMEPSAEDHEFRYARRPKVITIAKVQSKKDN